MPSADFSPLVKKHYYSFSQFPSHATVRGKEEISRGKTQNLPRVNAGFIKYAPLADRGLRGHVPTRPERTTSRLWRDSCSSPRAFGLGFLQTPPRDDALALLLAFGSAKTWHGDFHPISPVPCPAHTTKLSRGAASAATSAGAPWWAALQNNQVRHYFDSISFFLSSGMNIIASPQACNPL